VSSQDWCNKNFYVILRVPHDASQEAVKKAYQRLARQYHPDINVTSPSSEQQFKRIGEAYAVLANPERRRTYDSLHPRHHRSDTVRRPPSSASTDRSDERQGPDLVLWWWQSSLTVAARWWSPLWSAPTR
jgi:curved DNA-binding protein CbpA